MFAKPQAEHQWLDKLLGEWVYTGECDMGPDQPKMKHTGKVSGRSLGGLWIMLEMTMSAPDGNGASTSVMSLGFDPEQQKYVGTFFGSMMAQLWIYSGTVDASGKKLTLDTRGPKFDGSGQTAYQDIVEWTGENEWTLSSQLQQDDGSWKHFMTATHRRP
jgi:hypothetical protein